MERDFNRTADRYTTLFQDLDRELANRIKALDQPAFTVRAAAAAHDDRCFSGSLSIVPTLVASEANRTRTNLGVCGLRRSAIGLLQRAGAFLTADRNFREALESLLTPGHQAQGVRLAPVMLMELHEGGAPQEYLYPQAPALPNLAGRGTQQSIRSSFRGEEVEWVPMDEQTRTRIDAFLAEHLRGGDERNERVDAMTMSLWRADRPAIARSPAGRPIKGDVL